MGNSILQHIVVQNVKPKKEKEKKEIALCIQDLCLLDNRHFYFFYI
jgi:hypothetical protein